MEQGGGLGEKWGVGGVGEGLDLYFGPGMGG